MNCAIAVIDLCDRGDRLVLPEKFASIVEIVSPAIFISPRTMRLISTCASRISDHRDREKIHPIVGLEFLEFVSRPRIVREIGKIIKRCKNAQRLGLF